MESVSYEGWSGSLKEEMAANVDNGRVGNRLLLENEEVRVWSISLQPGERLPFHKHVLNYFWTALVPGTVKSHFSDGRVATRDYEVGDTQFFYFEAGDYLFHDTENIGTAEIAFTTVELLRSENPPLRLTGLGGAS